MNRSETEISRIRQVYGGYLADTALLGRWSADSAYKRHASRERLELVGHALREAGIAELRSAEILEVGCWTGGTLLEFIAMGAAPERLHGIDLMEAAIAEARQRVPAATFTIGNAEKLPYP